MWICASTTSMACSFPVWTSAGTVSLAEILAVFKRRETPGGERAPWLPHWSMIRGGTARALAPSLTLARKEDSTRAVADRVAKNPPTTVPQTPLPNVTYAVGGVTIMAGGKAIGAIGVSGAPGGQFDEECARAAIAKIQERMK